MESPSRSPSYKSSSGKRLRNQPIGVGAPIGVKASADDAVVEGLIYPCQRGYRAMK